MSYRVQNPSSEVTFTYDCSDYLDTGVTIADAVWSSLPTGLTFASESESGQNATVVISGVVDREVYKIFCTLTDSNGLTQKIEALTIRGAAG